MAIDEEVVDRQIVHTREVRTSCVVFEKQERANFVV